MNFWFGVSFLWGCWLLGLARCGELKDPFLLPYGPKNGDMFATKDGCSLGTDLEHSFKIGNKEVDKVYVCLDGVLKFSTPPELFEDDYWWWWDNEFDWIHYAIVAPFLSDHGIDHRFLDERCSYSVEENSFYGYDGSDWCREVYSESFNDYNSWYRPWDHSTTEEHLHQIKQLHDRNLTREQLEVIVHGDDETARLYFGNDTTKYVNLADNIMRRQVTEGEDLEILTKIIQQKEGAHDVIVDWAFVVTWYKIRFNCYESDWYKDYDSSEWDYSSDYNWDYDYYWDYNWYDYSDYYSDWEYQWNKDRCFASFQLSVACGSERCFSIFNYFEVNGNPDHYYWYTQDFYCGLFTKTWPDEQDQPIQCKENHFSHEQLVQGSNIGVKGVWLYELDQSGQGNVTLPGQLNHLTESNPLTVSNFRNYDHDEPFLLKFGPNSNDKFLPANYYGCFHAETPSKTFMFGEHEVEEVYVCQDGIVSFNDDYVSTYRVLRGSIYYDEAVISPLIFDRYYYSRVNFFDYTCLLFDNTVYQDENYFNDVCFRMATRNFYNQEEFDITFDDEESKILFGVNTTKYVNLAGNMFKREITNAQDLEKINQLINTELPSFHATSGYVVTWYKVGYRSYYYYDDQEFNSFQSIIACGDNKDCVVINDYYEMQWGGGQPEIGANSAWVQLNITHGDRDTLTSSGNFGMTGLWVFYFPGDGSEPVTDFGADFFEKNDQNGKAELAEPFILPFGPKYNDSFSYQHRIYPHDSLFSYRTCSLPQILDTPLTLSGIQFDWLFVCLNGEIELRSFRNSGSWGETWADELSYPWYHRRYDNNNRQYEGLDSFALSVRAFTENSWGGDVKDNQVDYLCKFAREASSPNDLYFQYLDDSFCPDVPNWWDKWNWNDAVTMMGWTDKETLEAVIDWNTKGKHKDIDFQSDDSLSEMIFGEESTKYINLANNIFRRESTNDSDLQLITEFIRSNPENEEFQATWCAVATWYKVASVNNLSNYDWRQEHMLQWFNSFQLIMACDNTTEIEKSPKCFAIYDYFEVQSAVDTDALGISLNYNAAKSYKIPIQYESLSSSSNYGSPGKWVFDLSDVKNKSNPDEDISAYNNRELNKNDEPFLLPFGPKHGDYILEKYSYTCCYREEFSSSQLTVNSQLFHQYEFCTDGALKLKYPTCYSSDCGCGYYWYSWRYESSSCEYPVLTIYNLQTINTEDNLIDYMCSENYLNRDDVEYWRWGIDEFCPLVDNRWENRHPLRWDEYWWYTEYEQNQLGITDEQREAIEQWNDFLSDNPENIDVTSDDELARAIFGSETTKYVNLANNVFKRETMEESDLSVLTSFLRPVNPGFAATWAFVATWYKIPPDTWPRRLNYNSYQAIITCDVKTDSTSEDDVCFVVFDYFEIQWTGSEQGRNGPAHCGVKENWGNFVELPTSGTEEVRNLWVESNIAVPGMWVIELGQNANDRSIQLSQRKCVASISPQKVLMHAINTVFTLSDYLCNEDLSSEYDPEIKVVFTGAKHPMELWGTFDKVSGNVTCKLLYWGEAEEVVVTLEVNGVAQFSSSKVLFYNSGQMIKPQSMLKPHILAAMQIEVDLASVQSAYKIDNFEMNLICLFKKQEEETPTIDTHVVKPQKNKVVAENKRTKDSYSYVMCMLVTSEDEIYSDPIKGDEEVSCETWAKNEEKRDLSKCEESLSRWYGCPRETNTRRWWWGQMEDEWYARTEVDGGVMGWEYDVCCNDQDLDSSATVSQNGYCNNCEFNPGADFCIKSIPVACVDGNTDEVHYVSNQCCYSEGNLIEESESGVGTMHLEESTAGNIVDHSESDLQPYKSCCLEDEGTDGCDTFYKYRPVLKGSYWSRVVRGVYGDPHITTIDNTTYTFNGLNVYTLLVTNLTEPTYIQASTRVSGKGTLFSGLAVKYKTTVFECFITKDGEFNVVINNEKKELHVMKTFTTNNIVITEDSDENSFTFVFSEKDMIVKVLITNSFLNFFTSVPPTFYGRMRGLLGFYDGDPENDLQSADGVTVNVNSNMTTIHNEFGESWAVNRRDWIFAYESFVQEILQDMEDGVEYEASYEATFDTPELEEAAKQACNNDTKCLLDVALVGDISIAHAFAQTETQLTVFDVLNEIFHSNVPNETIFREVIEQIEETIHGGNNDDDDNNYIVIINPGSGNGMELGGSTIPSIAPPCGFRLFRAQLVVLVLTSLVFFRALMS